MHSVLVMQVVVVAGVGTESLVAVTMA
jgi:hypothetical protein